MGVVQETIKPMKGYALHLVQTSKYKTNTIVWRMKAPLNKADVTKRSLLPYVLQNSTKSYPSTTILRSHLDDLYGATFFVDLSKKGEYHIMSFSLEIANEKFLSDPTPLLQKGFQFLAEILLNPNVEVDYFRKDTVEIEKRNLKQRIQSLFDDKMRYSNFRLVEEMCQDEPYALHVHGNKDEVDEITNQSLFKYYQQAFSEDQLDLYVIGDVNEDEVSSYLEDLIQFEQRTPKQLEKNETAIKEKVHEVKEVQDINQGKLNIGYRTNVVYGSPDYYALQVFNGIYGGFSHSKLFINVREKASLAYYAASRVESHKGLLMVMAGIDNQNYEKAVTIIREQMDAMKSGDFTDQELEQTKAVIHNQILETIDTSRGTIEILYHNVVANQEISLDEWLEKMNKVTKEEIMEVAKKVELDTIYFLTGAEGGK
ncbi:EF-P 5-aminopentanol modification-associated protein YfmF [Bacillus sp. 03113]|uniref:EF-P 5-aminopentanol modification-associated protein YfmF n=1 Tax=Bacillus sp. 03113 TaxID=2578211 RepID=UPI001144649C|nr:pitrilysin family protein [Bacillus sp. 03113]